MYLLAQHGYGKSDKIEKGLEDGSIRGVVLSPRYENPQSLEDFIAEIRGNFADRNPIIIFDPQFYAVALPQALDVDDKLAKYPYYHRGLSYANFSVSRVKEYVTDVFEYQRKLPVSRLVAPTVYVDDIRTRWSQIALLLAQEAIEVSKKNRTQDRLLIHLVLDEAVLQKQDDIDELLEEMTSWEVCGFLLTIRCADSAYPAHLTETRIANLMYLVYVLAQKNEYEVIVTHSDFVGLLLHAVGAYATSTGWHTTQRQFSFKQFERSTGGSPSRDRYSSAPLLNSLLVLPELSTIVDNHLGDLVISKTPYDEEIARTHVKAAWPPAKACLHHWHVLAHLINEISAKDSTQSKVALVESWVIRAIERYRTIRSSGIEFALMTGPRNLEQMQRAIQHFKEEAEL